MAGAGATIAAVLGTGQTKYVAKRHDVSMNGLVREAIDRALADSGSTFDDIDAVVVGKAPDFFEGVMMPELFMADAMGATGKPMVRVHTAGSVGGSTAVVAASLVQSGKYRRVLAMAWEKQSESNAMWALSIPVPFIKPVGAGAGLRADDAIVLVLALLALLALFHPFPDPPPPLPAPYFSIFLARGSSSARAGSLSGYRAAASFVAYARGSLPRRGRAPCGRREPRS
jgi:hypothetical protein